MTQDAPDKATPQPMSKAYNPAEHESRVWDKWTAADAFHADPRRVVSGEARPYCILIPPPNVTAALHLGHALNGTIQDILIRAHRMKGYEALWMPGTDHAGIATQTMVDRKLKEAGKPGIADYKKKELEGGDGREEFIALVQEFKDEFEERITNQFQKMGCSCDWRRQRFTMDDICARAVREAFFQLFKDGLIYRGKRLVNWDPVTQTALADDEVEMEEVDGAFYYLRYPLVRTVEGDNTIPVTWGELAARGYPGADDHPDDEQAWITVATTRPETYLGDTGVAVNPKDPRAPAVRGLHVMLPIVGRVIPIVEDDYVVLPVKYGGDEGDAKAEMSTGFLKVTPAHDPNDYMIGQRHELEMINIMAPDASISDQHGWDREARGENGHVFLGRSREEARKLVIEEFKARTVAEGSEGSLLEKIVPHRHSVGHSYRSHVPVEPYLSDQWYCKVTDDRLRGNAQRALKKEQRTQDSLQSWSDSMPGREPTDGTMTFHPARYAKTYETWHDNLRDWCISRQLWWGHRIPVWYKNYENFESQEAEVDPLRYGPLKKYKACAYGADEVVGNSELGVFICVANPDEDIVDHLESLGFVQDPDVLDTWFSSALWPLSTMGWPDPEAAAASSDLDDFTELLKAYNPSSVLTTAREIITLWVSRMVMFNRYFGRSALRADSSSSGTKSAQPEQSAAPTRSADLRCLTDLPAESVDSDRLRTVRPSNFVGRDPYPPDAPSPRDLMRKDRRLPHIELEKATYFVTWKAREGVHLDEAERRVVVDSLTHWHGRGCETYAFTVMSNHVHALVRLPEDIRLTQWCSSIKKFSAIRINEIRGSQGSLWQPDRFDHIVRHADDLNEFLAYIIRNSWEAGVVERPSEDRFCFVASEVAEQLVGRHSVPTKNETHSVLTAPDTGQEPARSAGLPPFKDVFIHAMIQDGEGRKMSKTLGNGVDPLDIIESHGADAMRFTLCQMTTQTQDVRMPVEKDPTTGKNTSPKFDLGRNLSNKLWNAAKFAMMMLEKNPVKPGMPINPDEFSLIDRWMLSRVVDATTRIDAALRGYMFKDYADTLYDLFWRDFCDWYLESIKPTIADNPGQAAVLRAVFDAILRLMHPVMPFITETLHERIAALPMREIEGFDFETTRTTETLCQSGWPVPSIELRDEVAETAYERVRSLVTAVREVRAQSQVPPRRQIVLHADAGLAADIARWSPLIETLAGVETVTTDEPIGQSAAFTFEGREHRLSNLADALDVGAEKERLQKELTSIAKNMEGINKRLSNPGYVDKAPEHLVNQTRDQLAQLEKDHAATKAALDRLG